MKFNLPTNVEYVLDTLYSSGHDAYIVGGCVRDLLCNISPQDYDITTSALPHEIQSLFEKTVDSGVKHGTITVILDNEAIEVTTFRTETIYNDNRHPEKVNFVKDVTLDLARRDFTVNAMCYNHKEGLIDCFNGKKDIKNKILRTVGNAEARFDEDALRILRLFRFASTLEFNIEQKTFNAAIKCSHNLKNISAERIYAELKKAVCGNNLNALYPLLETNSLENYCLKSFDLNCITKLKNKPFLRFFAFLNLTSFNLQESIDALKCSKKLKDYCLQMNFFTKNIFSADKISIKKALNLADVDIVNDILLYYKHILNIDVSKRKNLLDEIITNCEPYKISQLDISGNDIANLGFSGLQVGEKLEFLLNEVIENPSKNQRQKLLNLICH